MTPDPEDLAFGQKLVSDGWLSTSNKFRSVARHVAVPTGKDLVRPELHDTEAGRQMILLWDRTWRNLALRCGHEGVARQELTVKQYRAFRLAGGGTA